MVFHVDEHSSSFISFSKKGELQAKFTHIIVKSITLLCLVGLTPWCKDPTTHCKIKHKNISFLRLNVM